MVRIPQKHEFFLEDRKKGEVIWVLIAMARKSRDGREDFCLGQINLKTLIDEILLGINLVCQN